MLNKALIKVENSLKYLESAGLKYKLIKLNFKGSQRLKIFQQTKVSSAPSIKHCLASRSKYPKPF